MSKLPILAYRRANTWVHQESEEGYLYSLDPAGRNEDPPMVPRPENSEEVLTK